MKRVALAVLIGLSLCNQAVASEAVTPAPEGSDYHYVSHYSLEVDASVSAVWQQVVDLKSWMHEFELASVAGEPGETGEVLRLYPNQPFLIQVTARVPEQALVFANLPVQFNGETLSGVAVITIADVGKASIVNVTLSRYFRWDDTAPNPSRALRESETFQNNTRAMWQERFLPRLKALAESR